MHDEERLRDLLQRWQALRQRGEDPMPEALCRDCPELLDELQRRIAARDDRFGTPTAGDTTGPVTEPVFPPPPRGAVAPDNGSPSRYRPVRFHARGGLGEVFVAEDRELGRAVALKRIRDRHAADPESRRRFRREAEITGRLEHPGVVPVYGLVRDDDGQPCYAMRFIQGESLQEAIERFQAADRPGQPAGERSLALRQLLGRFVAVCNAVAYAHSRGVLHRDLKPANVMLGRYGETLVVDWGLARPFARTEAERATGEETLTPTAGGGPGTQVGQALGTPAFMSPEQAAGRLDDLGPASDVYSLGATLYVLLTGQAPFRGSSVADVLDRVGRGDFVPPRQARPGVPAALDAVCRQAMALRPEARYGTAQELAADVERWLADEPVSAYREPWAARLGRRARRHRTVVAAGVSVLAALAAALAVGLALVNGERQRTEAQRVKAVEEGERADANARTAAEQRGLALDTLREVVFDLQKDLEARPGTQELRRKLLKKAQEGLRRVVRSAETANQIDHNRVWAYHQLGEISLQLGEREDARRYYEDACRLASLRAEADPAPLDVQSDLAVSHGGLGRVLLQLGDLGGARDACRKQLEILRGLARDHPADAVTQHNLVVGYADLAEILLEQGDLRGARDAFTSGLEVSRRARAQDDLGISSYGLGKVLAQLGDLRGARDAFEEARAVFRRQSQADPDDAGVQNRLAASCSVLGQILVDLRDLPGARDAARESLGIFERLARDQPDNAETQRNLGTGYKGLGRALLQLGDARGARDAFRKQLEICQHLARAAPPGALAQRDLASAYEDLGEALLGLDDLRGTRDAFQKEMEVRRRLAQADPLRIQGQLDLLGSYSNLGLLARQEAQYPDAAGWFEQALAVLRRLEQEGKLKDLPEYRQRGNEIEHQRDVCRAAPRAIEDLAFALAQPAPLVADLLAVRATALARRGRHAEAAATAQKLADLAPATGGTLYDAARCYALCAGAVAAGKEPNRADRERYAARAVELLGKAEAAGYFQDPATARHLEYDRDLDALRDHPGYRGLLARLRGEPAPAPPK